jgi:selenocysteine lyase/cysteine desulfurase
MHYLFTGLSKLRHDNGKEIVKIFGPKDRNKSGSNLILNIFDEEGHLIPFEFFEEMANEQNISIRSGCFCNPGIDEINNCLTNDELSNYFLSRDKGNYEDMIAFLKKMRGATRVSVGMATTKNDLDIFLDFVNSFSNKQLSDLKVTQTLV